MGKKALAVSAHHLESFFRILRTEKVERMVRLVSNDGKFSKDSEKGFFDLPSVLADRHWCETEPFYVQLIPYITFYRKNEETKEIEIFSYTRGKAGNENRLHDKISVGVGGHIEELPNSPEQNLRDVLFNATLREIEEELGEQALPDEIGLVIWSALSKAVIYLDTRTPTEAVHLGVFLNIEANFKDWTPEQGVLVDSGWRELPLLRQQLADGSVNIEPWSKVVLDNFRI